VILREPPCHTSHKKIPSNQVLFTLFINMLRIIKISHYNTRLILQKMQSRYMKDQDSIFFRNFSMLLGFLVFTTIVLAVVGYKMHNNLLSDDGMAKDRTAIAKVIEPVAKVNTGDVIAIKEEVEEVAVAFEGSTDGKMIYQNVCSACHGTGAAGAPKLEAAAWKTRLTQGIDKLVSHAINGFQGTVGFMPAKGGRADLSDEQVKATVEFMTSSF